MQTVIVTRHAALVEYLRETMPLLLDDIEVLSHATVEQVRSKHVIGVLPLSLAAYAALVTEVPLALAPEDRGKELGIERLREIAGEPVSYQVQRVR